MASTTLNRAGVVTRNSTADLRGKLGSLERAVID